MEQLGYLRNAVARALATRRSGTLGVITFDTVLHGPVTTLYGVEQAAGALGLGVSIAVVDQITSTPSSLRSTIPRTVRRRRGPLAPHHPGVGS